jgi:hypothetical protein
MLAAGLEPSICVCDVIKAVAEFMVDVVAGLEARTHAM